MPTSSYTSKAVNGVVGGVKSGAGYALGGAAAAIGGVFDGITGAIGNILGIFTSQTGEKHVTLNLSPIGENILPGVTTDLSRLNIRRPPTQNISQQMNNNKKSSFLNYDTYPPELDFSKYWIEFQFGEYVRPYFGDGDTSFNPSYKINLPLPPQLSDAQALGWQAGNLGATGLAANEIQKSIKGIQNLDTSSFNSLYNDIRNKTNIDVTADKIIESIGYGLFNSSTSVLGVNLAQAIGNVIGYSPNPFPGAWYVGPELRQFQFSWLFVPESEEDTYLIKKIIHQIRKRTLSQPTGELGAFLKYPEICKIKLHPDTLSDMFPIKECALTGINVDYAPYGLSFHTDQNPTAIGLGLVFAEIRPLFRTDYPDELSKNGMTSKELKDALPSWVNSRS